MRFSKKWLQSYIEETLPSDQTLSDVITFNAFEVEEVISEGGDSIFDIKVLPNRAHDTLGHRGMARDISALLNLTFIDKAEYYEGERWQRGEDVVAPLIKIADTKACTRFVSARIDGVTVGESPEWLKGALQAIGQRSISNIVDITNYVQFSINKPMHAYDANLVSGGTLEARFAKEGETLRTLDDKELTLSGKTLVIADSEKPLGLAGIKGGKFSGVSTSTTSLILESANFNSSLIRKTANFYNIKTDASKRFENGIDDSLVEEGLRMTIALIQKVCPEAKVSELVVEGNKKSWDYVVSVSEKEVNNLLGTSLTNDEIGKILSRLGFVYEKKTLKEMIEKRIEVTEGATYKNPSSMRLDAPNFFSCSSFVSFLFNGVWQPSISIDKYVYGEKIEEKDLKWGDLIFSNSGEGRIYYESVDFLPGTKVESGIDHVGMYRGEGKVLHISKGTNKVVEEELGTSSSFKGASLYARLAEVDEERFFVSIPNERLDLRIKEDLIEEIARVYGLSNIKGAIPKLNKNGLPHKRLYYETKIKNILFANGFSEIYTYTFGDKGEVTLTKAVMDKKKLRTNLSDGVKEAFTMNLNNAPLLGVKEVHVFEFGNVFTKESETRNFCFALDDGAKKSNFSDSADLILSEIKRELVLPHLEYEVTSSKPYMVEINFDELLSSLPEPFENVFLSEDVKESGMKVVYKSVSQYPFIVRDIAVWVPKEISFGLLQSEIEKVLEGDKNLLAREVTLFDEFTKEERTSYAFRLVIQSHEKTLTDEEANAVANKVYEYLKGNGYEVR
jgi:phenylalanyl-tRNA synthetase beta subunit